jgi:dTDP-D-glucose 4,6-dehydratase
VIEYVEDRAFNDQRYYLETSKLSELGWEEAVEWETGIKETIDWYLSHGETWFNKDIRCGRVRHRQPPNESNRTLNLTAFVLTPTEEGTSNGDAQR